MAYAYQCHNGFLSMSTFVRYGHDTEFVYDKHDDHAIANVS